jgi:thiamine-monophosphate kinase
VTGAGPGGGDDGELAALERLTELLPPAPEGETWIGDDAAVLDLGTLGPLLLATDLVAEGVHFDLGLSTLADVGWKVLAVNVSDVVAMGGRPLRAVVAVAGASIDELDGLYAGLGEAAARYGCPIVGGDLSAGARDGGLVVSVAVLGSTDGRPAVLRRGARPGDRIYVTGPLGRAAGGLRLLRADAGASGELVEAHRRPTPRAAEGLAAAECGASAMIDCSDGLGIDLDRLARASGVGVVLDLLPVAEGATREEALGGGEDYELVFCAAPAADVRAAFAVLGLTPPIEIGRAVADASVRLLEGDPLPVTGYQHRLG